MTPDQFFAKFALFADAPGGVEKLRALALDLAIHGKLVSQNGEEGSAENYLKKTTALLTSSLSNLPFQWTWARVDETGWVDLGRQRAPQHHQGPNMRPYLRVQNVYEAQIDVSDVKWMNFSPAEFETFALQEGDILLNEGQSHKLVGRPAIYRGEVPGACFQNTLVRYRSREFVLPEYALIVFRAYMRNGRFQQISKQTTNIAHLSAGRFAALEFPLPPLAEQKRIVAKVDELMALCDQLESQQKQRETKKATLVQAALTRFTDAPTPASLEFLFHKSYAIDPAELRKTILTLAVTGRLVPQDPNDKSANTLLSSSANGGASTLLKTDDEKPFELPGGWVWAKFSQLGELGRGKSKHRPRNDPSLYSNGKYPLVQTGDVARSNGKISTYTGLYNEDGLAQSKMWPKGTLCITIAANIADSGVLEFDACFPDSVVGFVPNNKDLQLQYFEYFMRTAKSQLEKFAPATAQKNINLGILEEVSIPLPPASEQMRIVAKVEELMGLVDKLEAQLAASRDAGAKLIEAVVAAIAAAA